VPVIMSFPILSSTQRSAFSNQRQKQSANSYQLVMTHEVVGQQGCELTADRI